MVASLQFDIYHNSANPSCDLWFTLSTGMFEGFHVFDKRAMAHLNFMQVVYLNRKPSQEIFWRDCETDYKC